MFYDNIQGKNSSPTLNKHSKDQNMISETALVFWCLSKLQPYNQDNTFWGEIFISIVTEISRLRGSFQNHSIRMSLLIVRHCNP